MKLLNNGAQTIKENRQKRVEIRSAIVLKVNGMERKMSATIQ